MSFKDLSARMKAAREDKHKGADEAKSFDYVEAYRLRGKMLGVLLRDARVNAVRSVDDCARLLRIDPSLVEAWEYGEAVPSLPQLELLAYYLDVPVSHFWGLETLEAKGRPRADTQEEYMNLRHRMIGALLRQARDDANKTIEEVSQATNIPVASIEAYELGELSIPMNELSALASVVSKNIGYFLETSSQIGELLAIRERWKHFNDLPEHLREFAAKPTNVGFIEIALMFSQMPLDNLKRIATSMLDITGY
jgi:transcriptional regulator with XRE-family HTH domain